MPVNRLDSAALERTLRTVGMKTFVDFYKDFSDLQITLTDIKLKLSKNEENSSSTVSVQKHLLAGALLTMDRAEKHLN